MTIDNFTSTITNSYIPYQLPRNWKWFFWSDLMKSYQQGLIRSNNQLGFGNVRYLKMGDIDVKGFANLSNLAETNANDKEIKTYLLKNGDFLINVRNTKELVGKTCIINNTNSQIILFNHMLVRIDHGDESLNYFVNAFLNIASSKKLLDGIKQGTTTVIALYQRELNKIPIPLPDDKTLNGIVNFYKSIISKIELNNKINAELEQMAKTLYDYWFVQFDFPDENGKPYKSSGGEMIWSKELKRHIPKGWEVKTLGDICDIYQPKTISEKDCVEDGKYFVHGSNGIIGKYNDYNHEYSEIIVSCRGDCGNIHRTIPKMWITGNAMVFKMRDKTIHNEFLYQALRHSGIKNISSGSVQGQITRTNVSPLKIIIPEKKVINQFSEIAKNLVSKKLLINEENQKLAELRDFLLPMLMNGQVTVE